MLYKDSYYRLFYNTLREAILTWAQNQTKKVEKKKTKK